MNFILPAALGFALGDYGGLAGWWPLLVWTVLLGLFMVGMAVAFYLDKTGRQWYLVSALGVAISSGGFLGAQALCVPEGHLSRQTGREITLVGTIEPASVRQEQGKVYLRLQGSNYAGKALVTIKDYPAEQVFPLYGELTVRGKLNALQGFANPGGFDYQRWARKEELGGRLLASAPTVQYRQITKPVTAYAVEISRAVRAKLTAAMGTQDAAILNGMLLGGYSGIGQETVSVFSQTGIIHILSVSGTHVALLAGCILSLAKFFRLPPAVTLLVTAVFFLVYGLLCGFVPPVVRSLCMGIALLLEPVLEKERDQLAVLAGTLLVLLGWRPLWLWDVGFQLSFLATAGLLLFAPRLRPVLVNCLPACVAEPLTVCLAAQSLVLPLLVYHFHKISLIALAANVLVVPLLEFSIVLTALGVLVAFVLPVAGRWLLVGVAQLLGLSLWGVELLAAFPYGTVTVGCLPGVFTPLYYLVLSALTPLPPLTDFSRPSRHFLAGFTVTCCLLVAGIKAWQPQPFTVYFLDVGQGDSALVITPEKRTILIDTGGLPGMFDTGSAILVPFFHYLGLEQLDVLVLSHGHHDHAGGAAAVAKNLPIGQVLLPRESLSQDVVALLAALPKSTAVNYLTQGEQYALGSCHMNFLAVPEQTEAEAGNESSVLVQVRCGVHQVLFTGDATAEGELGALAGEVASTVLKVSHHGSKTSSDPAFLQAVHPQLAVISVGRENRFGHPHAEVVERLVKTGAKVLRTDETGALKMVFDDKGPTCYSYRYQKEFF